MSRVRWLNLNSAAICMALKKPPHFSGLKFNYNIKLACLFPRRGIAGPDIYGP